jgi:hypothetical protein
MYYKLERTVQQILCSVRVSLCCSQVGLPGNIRKVIAADDFVISGLSEAVVDVFVGRSESDDSDECVSYIMSPQSILKRRTL